MNTNMNSDDFKLQVQFLFVTFWLTISVVFCVSFTTWPLAFADYLMLLLCVTSTSLPSTFMSSFTATFC
jgi:hypothetical protein